ncbi:MAG: hypothetical protein LBE31_03270 [Deltaproteobacteria bacterium]|nr:hypothetical protein [Deltaproteobacteria bacterium]
MLKIQNLKDRQNIGGQSSYFLTRMIQKPDFKISSRVVIFFNVLAFLAFLAFVAFFIGGSKANADTAQAEILLTAELDRLKHGFENEIKQAGNQNQISALAIRAAALAWATSASAVGGNLTAIPEDRLAYFDREWEKAKDSWPTREILALRMYFEAVGRLAISVALLEEDAETFESLSLLLTGTDFSGFGLARTKLAQLAEDRVFWSNRLSSLATIIIRLQSPDQNSHLIDQIEDLINRSEVISRRADIHYQARMELLYLNNAQSLASMLFLMAKSKASPIVEQATIMETAWQKHIDGDNQVADLNSLTWVANTQISFPLAWWVASGRLNAVD